MAGFNLPYQPIRQQLYTSDELFRGFEPSKPESWEQRWTLPSNGILSLRAVAHQPTRIRE